MLAAALEGRAIGEFIATTHCGGGGGGRGDDMACTLMREVKGWRVETEKVDDGECNREGSPQLLTTPLSL